MTGHSSYMEVLITQKSTQGCVVQANLVKQLAKLVKVRYVEDITASERVGAPVCCPSSHMCALPTCSLCCVLYVPSTPQHQRTVAA